MAPDLRKVCLRPAVTVRISLFNMLNDGSIGVCPLLPLPSWTACPARIDLHRLDTGGETVIFAGRVQLFRFAEDDTAMRHMAAVVLRQLGFRGQDVAAVLGLTPNYVATLHQRALREGTAGLIRPPGRPRETGEASWERARQWRAAGASGLVAIMLVGFIAARKQHAYSPIIKHAHQHTHIDWVRVGIVGLILAAAIATNVTLNLTAPEAAGQFPYIGVAVWLIILASVPARRPDWELLPESAKGATFLLSLVLCASMMPVEKLPFATWPTTLGLGFVSSVFDNIPLTALAIKQGGYDWGFLAYAVGFGGSMVWFGSSAGVALSNMFPEARSVGQWLKHGWMIVVAYVVGFLVLL